MTRRTVNPRQHRQRDSGSLVRFDRRYQGTWIPPANKWTGYYNNKLDPPRDTSLQAMFFGGQGFTSWGVALGVGVAACVDATPYTGVTFWAKSTSGTALPVKFDSGNLRRRPNGERRWLHRHLRGQVRNLADHSHRMEANPDTVLRFRSGHDDHPHRQEQDHRPDVLDPGQSHLPVLHRRHLVLLSRAASPVRGCRAAAVCPRLRLLGLQNGSMPREH